MDHNDTTRFHTKARLIAFYLPQYHPIPENDEWWGKGFTEWTNVAKARPLFPGHYQPNLPADLGFYDLRVPEVRIAQAELARTYGIEAFCYWHYWFAGRRIIERPFNEVLKSGEPDFPFCLGWANQTWSGIWHGAPNRILIEQTYPGMDDHTRHFYELLDAFNDPRYVKVDGKPLFLIYAPDELPDEKRVLDLWRELAVKEGLKGLHLVAHIQAKDAWVPASRGYDAITIANQAQIRWIEPRTWVERHRRNLRMQYCRATGRPFHVYRYQDAKRYFLPWVPPEIHYYPCAIPNWDNTPRSGVNGMVLQGATPELFGDHLKHAIRKVENRPFEDRIVFIKSWNEWAEGNYLEPDRRFGRAWLDAVRDEVFLPYES